MPESTDPTPATNTDDAEDRSNPNLDPNVSVKKNDHGALLAEVVEETNR